MSAGNATREPLPTTALSPPATTPTAMSATRASTKAPAVISGISAPERTQRVAHVSDVFGDGRTRGNLVACDDRIENRLMLTSRTVQAALELEARATEIGRAARRERGRQSVSISVGGVAVNKKTTF